MFFLNLVCLYIIIIIITIITIIIITILLLLIIIIIIIIIVIMNSPAHEFGFLRHSRQWWVEASEVVELFTVVAVSQQMLLRRLLTNTAPR